MFCERTATKWVEPWQEPQERCALFSSDASPSSRPSDQNCRMIFSFTQEAPICEVSAFMINQYQSQEQISFDGLVRRVGECSSLHDKN